MARLIGAHPEFDPRAWLMDLPTMDAFGALVSQVIGQQLSVSATRGILGRLQDLFKICSTDSCAHRSRCCPWPPRSCKRRGFPAGRRRPCAPSPPRFADGSLRDGDLRCLSDHDVEALLTAIPGIGPWTVHGLLIIAFDRPDVVLPGDLALRKSIRRAYQRDHLPSPEEVLRRTSQRSNPTVSAARNLWPHRFGAPAHGWPRPPSLGSSRLTAA